MDVTRFVDLALDEDLGHGDLSTEATVPLESKGSGRVLAKESLVVCGHQVAGLVFTRVAERIGGEVHYQALVDEGERASSGQDIARVEGSLRAILSGERLALNLLMRLSGVATHARVYADAAGPGGPRVVDTRKTTPLLRALEKHAVRCGGAHNHRFALYDGVLIKDNHIAAVGGVRTAVERARAAAHHLVRVEVEVTDIHQVGEAIDAGADALLLDNMDYEELRAAVELTRARRPEVLLEASGNMNPNRIARIRNLGLDLVSAGGIIHQARWVDLSLDLDE